MVEGLHHIGIAVESIEAALPRWVDGFGLRLESIEEVASEKVKVAVIMAGPTRIELLEPMADDSPIARFLQTHGPGLHHLAFAVASAEETRRLLSSRGLRLLDAQPRPGAHGTRVVFVHPHALGGVLAELVQAPKETR